jgi:hypothetical protein
MASTGCKAAMFLVIVSKGIYQLTCFLCSANQYKAQFKKWGWSKNVRKNEITTIVKHYKGRAAVGKPSTRAFIKGKQVESQKVRREMKNQMREATRLISLNRNRITTVDGRVLPFSDSL